MNKVRQVFTELREQNQTALMPFVAAGDPDLEFTEQVILGLDQAGCHLLELGFPYSDPIADGPVIQESYVRALSSSVAVEDTFRLLEKLRGKVRMPIVAMVSYSIIYRFGAESFFERAKQAGVAGAIIPDLPLEELHLVSDLMKGQELALNPLVTPMTGDARAKSIAEMASGFVYFVSVIGTTGERTQFSADLKNRIESLRAAVPEVPMCIGFGISQPKNVRELAPLADGLIVGSAFMKRIARCAELGKSETLNQVDSFAKSLLAEL